MARITIEKELKKIPNKYLLTKAATERALNLVAGITPLIENKEGNKEVVVALREVAEGLVKIVEKKEELGPKEFVFLERKPKKEGKS